MPTLTPVEYDPFSGVNLTPIEHDPFKNQKNYNAANSALSLNPQEQDLYQRHLSNLYGSGGIDNPPDAENPQGSRSSLYMSVQQGPDGKYYNVPTVWDGQRLTQKYTQPGTGKIFDVPNDQAMQNIQKSGWDSFPSYDTPDQAVNRYNQMHDYMEKDTGDYFASKRAAPSNNYLAGIQQLKRSFLTAQGVDDPGGFVKYNDSPTIQQGWRDNPPLQPSITDRMRQNMNPGIAQGFVDTPLLNSSREWSAPASSSKPRNINDVPSLTPVEYDPFSGSST